jgi:hypothetical protein
MNGPPDPRLFVGQREIYSRAYCQPLRSTPICKEMGRPFLPPGSLPFLDTLNTPNNN